MKKLFTFRVCSTWNILFVLLLASCSPTKYITEYKTDTIYTHTNIHTRDSVYVDRWRIEKQKGDTIYITDSVEVYVEKIEQQTDTLICYKDRTQEVVREVRKRNWYDKFTACGFWIFGALFVVILLIKFLKWKWKR